MKCWNASACHKPTPQSNRLHLDHRPGQLHTWSRVGEAQHKPEHTNRESKGDAILAAGVEGQAGHGTAPLPTHSSRWDMELPRSQTLPRAGTESSQVPERPRGCLGTGGDHRVQRLAVG